MASQPGISAGVTVAATTTGFTTTTSFTTATTGFTTTTTIHEKGFDPPMISIALAATLKAAGLVWKPSPGDRFALTTGAFDGEVFTLSDMVVEAQESRTGTVLGFNGTTEWALDSTEATDALWLPREDQLRTLLGSSFRSLERIGNGYRVTSVLPGDAGVASEWWSGEELPSEELLGNELPSNELPSNELLREELLGSELPGGELRGAVGAYWGEQPSEAYGRALLALIRRATN